MREKGTSYQNQLDLVRKDLAIKYIDVAELSICEIAFLLGFSEQSAFNRRFKKWTGASPGKFRKKYQLFRDHVI